MVVIRQKEREKSAGGPPPIPHDTDKLDVHGGSAPIDLNILVTGIKEDNKRSEQAKREQEARQKERARQIIRAEQEKQEDVLIERLREEGENFFSMFRIFSNKAEELGMLQKLTQKYEPYIFFEHRRRAMKGFIINLEQLERAVYNLFDIEGKMSPTEDTAYSLFSLPVWKTFLHDSKRVLNKLQYTIKHLISIQDLMAIENSMNQEMLDPDARETIGKFFDNTKFDKDESLDALQSRLALSYDSIEAERQVGYVRQRLKKTGDDMEQKQFNSFFEAYTQLIQETGEFKRIFSKCSFLKK